MCLAGQRGETLSPAGYFRHPFHFIISTEPNTPTQPAAGRLNTQHGRHCLHSESPVQGGCGPREADKHWRMESRPHRSQLCGPRSATAPLCLSHKTGSYTPSSSGGSRAGFYKTNLVSWYSIFSTPVPLPPNSGCRENTAATITVPQTRLYTAVVLN